MAFNVSATTTNKIENYTTPGDVTEIRTAFGTDDGEQVAADAPPGTEQIGGSRPWWRRRR